MTQQDDIEEAGERYRAAVLDALSMLGLSPERLATEMNKLLVQDEDLDVKSRAVDRVLELNAAMPKRTARMRIDSTSRALRISLGDGAIAGIDTAKLKTLPPEERQQAVRLLARLRETDPTEPTTET